MKAFRSISRRHFLQSSMFGSAALAVASLPRDLFAGATKPSCVPDHGLKLGMASYTLRKFTLEQAIAMTKKTGVNYITL